MYKLIMIVSFIFFSGCAHNAVMKPIDGYESLGTISKKGFAKNKAQVQKLNGKVVKLWGYIDFANTYTCARKNWYFSLKADKDAEAGESIHINTPADYSFRDVYYDIRQMQKTDQKTPVLVKGVLKTFDAPTNFANPIGIEIDVKSPEDVKFR